MRDQDRVPIEGAAANGAACVRANETVRPTNSGACSSSWFERGVLPLSVLVQDDDDGFRIAGIVSSYFSVVTLNS